MPGHSMDMEPCLHIACCEQCFLVGSNGVCNSMTASKVRLKWKDGDGSTKASNKRPSKLRMTVYSGKNRLGRRKMFNTTNIPPSGWQRPQRRVQDHKHTALLTWQVGRPPQGKPGHS